MRKVQIYVNNKRVDLFNDEKIVVKSSVQDIADIAKVFTDFSQSFTLPASDNNNEIFGFYYNNDNDSFDANTRVDARIEIDFNKFRKGKLQLEGTTIKNNQIESYKVTFYGDVVTLKDVIGEAKLRDLDYSSISQNYSGSDVEDSITDPTFRDIRFPLISSDRIWTYNDGSGIDLPAQAVGFDELFPAVSDAKIMEIIEDTFNVTFQGNFLTDQRFKKSYTWWKNSNNPNFTSEPIDITFNPLGTSCTTDIPNAVGTNVVNVKYVNLNTFPTPPNFGNWIFNTFNHTVQIAVFNTSTSSNFFVDVYKNGTLINTITGSNSIVQNIVVQNNFSGLDDEYTFQFRSNGAMSFDFNVEYTFQGQYLESVFAFQTLTETCNYTTTGLLTSGTLNLTTTAPDMKVTDWLAGTLKQFNLTCYPLEEEKTYQIEPLEDWYAAGDIIDITKYVNTDTIQVDRLKLYNEINFEYVKSKAFLNDAFEGINARQYGNLKEVFNNDGGKYEVKLPFETLLFTNFDTINGNLQVSYCLEEPTVPVKPYIPKPVKLYLQDSKVCEFYFNDGTSNNQVSSYMPFGQEIQYNNAEHSINFGEEVSSLSNNVVTNSLYQTYYQSYLVNLFNTKSRKVSLECMLPLEILTKLTLDDAIIVRDKKYRINDMTSDLTSGLVKMVLVSDFVDERTLQPTPPPIPDVGGTIYVPVKNKNGGYTDFQAPIETPFITSSIPLPSTRVTGEQIWTITAPANTTGQARTQTIIYSSYYADGSLAWTRTLVVTQEAYSDKLLTESDGSILQENFDNILL